MTLPVDATEISVGELELHGRVMPASNATFLATVGPTRVVYKPVRGERPLWDFPNGTLAERERAAYLVSEALGWSVVPTTILREGPHGSGMVQRWQEPDEEQRPVDVVARGATRPGQLHVLDAWDEEDREVALVHEDSAPLRRMAVFDVLINNGDRKGGHVLAMPSGHRYGVDHGVSFHVDHKLRTVLWGWAGEPLGSDELAGVRAVQSDEGLHDALTELLTLDEVEAFRERAARLAAHGTFPYPSREWPAIPWPAF
ncbi:SCO1664 family protein [Nocardioides daejeonensis]|uniref:SCO1664 family protein n=1 Tax=Nocardioides daejeonensis TaxID=1046556 RepID=UPI001EF4F453|nr:SCO1664 family protein [Nocardioides daejeonensis]